MTGKAIAKEISMPPSALGRHSLHAVSQQAIPVVYDGIRIDTGFRADLVVQDKVIAEIKSVELLAPVHKKQLSDLFAARRQGG
jgi:GxxExxY protein